ncbi:MAG: Jag N-terminal domain-containing protein [Elusimicrobiales bacterium]|nr:Jag N-terminal domain-containing protein [Elusimicrobiales bacterium]
MRETKTEAKTIQDAVEKGLAELGLRRDQVEVVVVTEGTRGFLGIGAKKACVILREKRWGSGSGREEHRGERGGGRREGRGGRSRGGERGGSRGGRGGDRGERSSAPRRPGRYGYEDARLPPPEEHREEHRDDHREERHGRDDHRGHRSDRIYKEEPLAADYLAIQPAQDPVEHAKAVLAKLVSLMGMEATVTEAKLDTAENLLFIRFDCADPAVFTEENGRGLQALQFVLNSIVSRKREPHLALRLDTGGYWDSKEKEISRRVEEAVNDVKATSQPHRLDPMPASMRKIVHNLIKANYPGMETVSEGEGRWRKVVIRKVDGPQAAEQAPEQPAAQPQEQPAEQTTEQK